MKMNRLNVLVIGTGAMGPLFGGRLALAGHKVTLIDVWQEHIDLINSQGLTLNLVGETHVAHCTATRPEDFSGGPIDLTIVFTKSYQSRAALTAVEQALQPDTPILTLQNGLGNIEKYRNDCRLGGSRPDYSRDDDLPIRAGRPW